MIDPLGRHLGHRSFPTTPAGYQALAAWMATHGTVVLVGVEGTGAYGAGLTRAIAGRIGILDVEIAELDDDLHSPLTPLAPTLLALQGVGLDVAGQLLATAGDNPDRLRHEAAFAHLCGSAPIPASSGQTTPHRLDRGGARAANAALYRMVLCRLRWGPATRKYVERRTKEGRTRPRSSAA